VRMTYLLEGNGTVACLCSDMKVIKLSTWLAQTAHLCEENYKNLNKGTERRGRVVNNPYSRDPGFISRPGDRHS
jgi:hypothetical protein